LAQRAKLGAAEQKRETEDEGTKEDEEDEDDEEEFADVN
jgi:hypothetical protein